MRAEVLESKIKERALDLLRHLEALEHAMGRFSDEAAFEAAWQAPDPETLNLAYAVQAGYENVINGCITIAQELCELEGWEPPDASAPQALKRLHENGVITSTTRQALKDAQADRSDVQHDYVGTAGRVVYSAAMDVLKQAPLLLQGVGDQLRSRQG